MWGNLAHETKISTFSHTISHALFQHIVQLNFLFTNKQLTGYNTFSSTFCVELSIVLISCSSFMTFLNSSCLSYTLNIIPLESHFRRNSILPFQEMGFIDSPLLQNDRCNSHFSSSSNKYVSGKGKS